MYMCIDNPEKTHNRKSTQQTQQNQKKEKQTRDLSGHPKIKQATNKNTTAPHQDRTPIIKRVVESITVII